jgi:hypothetical protein
MQPVTIEKVRADYFDKDRSGREFYQPFEYFVYLGEKLIRVCPSLGMAREVAAGL